MSGRLLSDAERALIVSAEGGACDPPCEFCVALLDVVERVVRGRMEQAWAEGARSRCPDIDRCWCDPPHGMRDYPPRNPYREDS